MRLLLSLLFVFFALPALAAETHATLAKGGSGGWLNVTRPITEADMQGRVVLLDFWTYGCINCMQVVPDLEYLEQKFGDKLLIIGVHSAKFKGEQGSERILAAAKRFGLKHPVINDSDFAIWNSFDVQAWPTFVVLGPDGQEAARFSGEGHRSDLEDAITGVLPDSNTKTASIASLLDTKESGGVLSFPARMAFYEIDNDNGLLFVADAGHNAILALDGDFKTVETYKGFHQPRGIVVVGDTLYVADTGNHQIKTIDLKTKKISVVAGTGRQGYDRSVQNGDALKTSLASPWDIEPLADGRIAIAMAGLHQLWVYDPKTKTASVLAGNGKESIDDGAAIGTASLSQPSGLSRDGDTLYFVDAESSALRQLKDGTVTTLIGTGLFDFGLKDGTYPSALMQHPQGLFAENGKVYIADTYNNALRIYDTKTKQLKTVTLPASTLSEPGDLMVVMGMALVVDTNHHAIKQIDLEKGTVKTVIGD